MGDFVQHCIYDQNELQRFPQIEGYFSYVVPPLEGLWQQEGMEGIDYTRKNELEWFSMIRLPEFVTPDEFTWAKREVEQKKGIDVSKAEYFRYEEGFLCPMYAHRKLR